MPWILRSYDVSPPGRYPFEQFEGLYHFFPATPYIEAQADAVVSFRAANGLAGASKEQALLDIGLYTCKRLGYMSQFCVNTDNPTQVINSPPVTSGGGCRGCGVPVA